MISMLLIIAATVTGSCGDRPNQTAMTMCQKAAADVADAEMSWTWVKVKAKMQAADRAEAGNVAALLASQRAWLAFRDAECRIESYEWRGGSMQAYTENQCLTEVTKARTRQLRGMLEWTR